MGHAMMENRNGLVLDSHITHANGTVERTAAVDMIGHTIGRHRITVGADKGYDCTDFVNECRTLKATVHVARRKMGCPVLIIEPPAMGDTGSA